MPLEKHRSQSIKQQSFNIYGSDFLYYGLPCIYEKKEDKYIIFSPYALKIACIDPAIINYDITREKLEKLHFFGTPNTPFISKSIKKITLNVTTDCNLRCKYCFVVPKVKAKYMKPEHAIRILKEKIDHETKEIFLTFFGGEPTLNIKTIKEVVSYLKSLGIKTHFLINTNGTLPDRDLNYLIENNFAFIVSSDGLPEINDEQRPMADGEKVSKKIERVIGHLVEAKVLFKIRATITNKSIFYFKKSIDYWNSLNVKFVHFEPLSPSSNSTFHELTFPPPEIYIEKVISALDEAEHIGMWVISSPYMNLLTPSTYFCTSIVGEVEVYNPDGSISSCYRVQEINDPFQEFIIGKYNKKSDSFVKYKNRINFLRNINVFSKIECDSCFAKYICSGGCIFRNKVISGDLIGNDRWMCYVKKSLIHNAILRIAKSLNKGKVPVVFGESIFENLLRRNSKLSEKEVYKL